MRLEIMQSIELPKLHIGRNDFLNRTTHSGTAFRSDFRFRVCIGLVALMPGNGA
jgi:hypothetical protein